MFKKLLLIAVLPIALAACKDQEKNAAPAEESKQAEQVVEPKQAEPVVDPDSPPPPAKANTLERKDKFTAMYDCKEASIKADFDGKGKVKILAAGRESTLSIVNHEKGQRYETTVDAKPYVIFWDMDKEAIIEVDGREWMKCTRTAGE